MKQNQHHEQNTYLLLQMKLKNVANTDYTKYKIMIGPNSSKIIISSNLKRNKLMDFNKLFVNKINYAYKINLIFQPESISEMVKKQYPNQHKIYTDFMNKKETSNNYSKSSCALMKKYTNWYTKYIKYKQKYLQLKKNLQV